MAAAVTEAFVLALVLVVVYRLPFLGLAALWLLCTCAASARFTGDWEQ